VSADHNVQAPAGPIVVHVRNAKSGDIEVFSGTSQTRLQDKDLAARIARPSYPLIPVIGWPRLFR
jgi:hypothetical protein